MKYAWIRDHKLEFPLYLMCKVLKVGSSSYHRWIRLGSAYSRDTLLEDIMRKEFYSSYCTYGTRRLKAALANNIGLVVSRAKIRKTMKLLGLSTKTKRRFKVTTTDSNHNYAISPNRLQRDFSISRPNSVFVGDMTYIHTPHGWVL